MANPCECGPETGFCERHGIMKSDTLKSRCRTNRAYWVAWEQGVGLKQNVPAIDQPVPPTKNLTARRIEDFPCLHRGEVNRTEVCTGCGGKNNVDVYECSLFGECTVFFSKLNLTTCITCEEMEG